MEPSLKDQEKIRLYLLGRLADELQRQRIEEMLLVDDHYFREVEIIEDEIIDDYLEESLTHAECDDFKKHFLSTPDRYKKLRFAQALKKYSLQKSQPEIVEVAQTRYGQLWVRQLFSSPARIILFALLLLCAGLAVWRFFFYQTDVDKGLVALRAAYQGARPVQARISGFNYAPMLETRGSGQSNADRTSHDRAARFLLNAAQESPGPASYHALGQLYLTERDFKQAIEQFKRALDEDPNNAQLYNDMGAALLELGRADLNDGKGAQSHEEFDRSLEQFNRALELNPSLLEALFNRALCHQYLGLQGLAEEDWRNYLKQDVTSKWADEARQNLSLIESQKKQVSQTREEILQLFLNAYEAGDAERAWSAIDRGSSRQGNFITEALINNYLDLSSNGHNHEADEKLLMLLYVGKLKAQRAEDSYFLDLAKFYNSITPSQLVDLREAHELTRKGQDQITHADSLGALESYSNSQQIFDRIGDQCDSRLAEYWQAICYSQLNDQERSSSLFESLINSCTNDNYKWLVVRSLNGLASNLFTANQYSRALAQVHQSAELAERAHDTYGRLSALCFLIETYRFLGNYSQALSYIPQALALVDLDALEPKQAWLKFNEISWTLNSLGLYAAAADYQKTALQIALSLGEIQMICVSYIRLGIVYGGESKYDEALSSEQQALSSAGARSSEPIGQLMMAYAYLQIGDIDRKLKNFDQAIASYNSGLDLFKALRMESFFYQAHKGMLLSHIGAGEIDAARAELDTTLNLYDTYRTQILEQSNRNSFSDVEQDVFDVAIDFEYSNIGDPEAAFEYSERGRARSLLDLRGADARPVATDYGTDLVSPSSRPRTLTELRTRMPDEVQLLQYSVLEDRVILWLITKNNFRHQKVEIARKQLDATLGDYLQLVSRPESNQEETARLSKNLYDILIRPVEGFLDRSRTLVIVPDKGLNYLPFSALVSPSSGKYLIEDYKIITSPSSSMFVNASESARQREQVGEETLLSVGNPDFDRSEFTDLPKLPDAQREAEQVASYYDESSLLIGARATKAGVIKALPQADVIHLASHSIVDESSPMKSMLLLARNSAPGASHQISDEALQVSEIYQMDLPRAKLVVLSSCQSGVGRVYRGEGVMSIARPFLAKGVPLVIATLWSVESTSTAEAMTKFHQYRKRAGQSTVDALRSAQLEMLKSTTEIYHQPYYWASFNLIGGYADF